MGIGLSLLEIKGTIMKLFSPDNVFIATIGTLLTFLFGIWDISISCLATIMTLDYITGVIYSILTGQVNSKKGAKGILKKGLLLIVVSVAVLVDHLLQTENTFRRFTIYALFANEGISVLENVGKCNKNLVPKKLLQVLEQLKDGKIGEK